MQYIGSMSTQYVLRLVTQYYHLWLQLSV